MKWTRGAIELMRKYEKGLSLSLAQSVWLQGEAQAWARHCDSKWVHESDVSHARIYLKNYNNAIGD